MSHVRLIALLMVLCATGCRTLPELPPADMSQPGWNNRQGQAIWRANAQAPEIAGEVYFSARGRGESILQFIKTPFPIVIARTSNSLWRVSFPGDNRVYSGRGHTPARIGWFALMAALQNASVPKPWTFTQEPEDHWRLANDETGELIEGYLSP